MGYLSIRKALADADLATPTQFRDWRDRWMTAVDNGSEDRFIDFARKEKGVAEEAFLQKLAEATGLTLLDLSENPGENEARGKVSTKVAFQYRIIPVDHSEAGLRVAVSDPFDAAMQSAVEYAAREPVEFALATSKDIDNALKTFYGVGAETLDEMAEERDDDPLDLLQGTDKEISESEQDASVIKFVNQIIWEAFKDRATDIHFEPGENDLRIRYRVDGILHQAPMPPQLKRFQSALISRVKVMSGMDIAEKRLPQDGRINVRIQGEEIDIRVSTVPTVYGESVSLRLLTRGAVLLEMEKLGFSNEEEEQIRELIVKPHGIFLVTGPTGSGKSTSLYAFLNAINSITKRIITIEEPVEYELPGVNQIAVRSDIGLTFARGLRHILRQDPNVVMVGEIRDLETAEIAIRAALTGHLVFSTLHTNDAGSAFTRLIDMGIEPFLVASSVEAVMAQRLVRTICKSCATPQTVNAEYLTKVGVPTHMISTLEPYHGPGCEACRQLGYRGRTGIHELLVLTESIRSSILSRAAAAEIAQKAVNNGMVTLRNDGWKKVARHETTIEEVLRVTQSEEHKALLGESEVGVVV